MPRFVWTKDQSSFLYSLIHAKASVIEDKRSDSNSLDSKKKAWDEIVKVFNLKFPESLISLSQANDKWRQHKRDVKATTAAERRAVMSTGNDITIPQVSDDVAATKSIIGPQISPVNYHKDSDKIQANKRAFSPSDSEDEEGANISVQAPKIAKTSSDAQINAIMDMKRIKHEAEMASLKREEDRQIELHNEKMASLKRKEARDEEFHQLRMKLASSNFSQIPKDPYSMRDYNEHMEF